MEQELLSMSNFEEYFPLDHPAKVKAGDKPSFATGRQRMVRKFTAAFSSNDCY